MTEYENTTVFRDKLPKTSYTSKCQYEAGHTQRHGIPSVVEKDELATLELERKTASKYMKMESVISNPLCCGYLLQFCEAQHNSENVRFFLEVDEFRDMFAADKDKDIWEYSFEEIDNLVKLLETDSRKNAKTDLNNAVWPSSYDKSAALKKIDEILTKYLNNDSCSQVCISDSLIERTLNRVKYLHLYGPEVFTEATREPIKTMKKDILPRFLVSEGFRRMVCNVATCEPCPPPASDLKVPPPESWLLTISSLEELHENRKFHLDEVLNCLQLYNEFLSFLRLRVSSENLICARMIDIYEEMIFKSDVREASKQAWKIYQYFVAPGAAYEVSIHHIHRKHVMVGMAEPKKGMFFHIRQSVRDTLKVNFETFTTTEQYASLGKLMREQKVEIIKLQGGDVSTGINPYMSCFGMRK